jgi:hypothetical protein
LPPWIPIRPSKSSARDVGETGGEGGTTGRRLSSRQARPWPDRGWVAIAYTASEVRLTRACRRRCLRFWKIIWGLVAKPPGTAPIFRNPSGRASLPFWQRYRGPGRQGSARGALQKRPTPCRHPPACATRTPLYGSRRFATLTLPARSTGTSPREQNCTKVCRRLPKKYANHMQAKANATH